MHMLSSRNRSEFLAVPQLVRLTMAQGNGGQEATLLVKSSTLTLKYLLRLKRFRLFVFRVDSRYLAYGTQIEDDPDHPATLWSFLEYDDEAATLWALTAQPKCFVFLFNELAVNVAWGEVSIDLSGKNFVSLIENATLHSSSETTASKEVGKLIDALHRRELAACDGYATEFLEVTEWHPLENYYITNSISRSLLSIFETDEGRQQEETALWLIDNLQPTGAIRSPQIHELTKTRELSDLLLSYEYGTILIESKALGILARSNLPNRAKLANDVTKHLQKATRQLRGGVKNLRQGHKITDLRGREIEVERTKPSHIIVLVPDLALLWQATEFGGEFILRASSECGGFFHILDPSELLRIVQAAEMISAQNNTMSPMMSFDYYLMRRAEYAIKSKTPDFGVLFRRTEEGSVDATE
jgi:hypothetical protein